MAGLVKTDEITENSANAGVTVEAVPIKDGLVDGRDVAADGATLDAIAGAAIFGTSYSNATDDAESTTTSTTYQQKVKLTTPSLPTGTYRLGWSCEFGHSSSANSMNVKVEQDDTTILAETSVEPKDPGNYYPGAGIVHNLALSGVHDFDIDFRTAPGSSGTAKIRRARLEVWRLT